MTDQCKNCVVRGDIEKCLSTECFHHGNWISAQHKARHEALLAQVRELDLRLGLTKIALEHKSALLESCERALGKRDKELIVLSVVIEEETVERCARFAEGCDKSTHPTDLGDGLIHMPRKYQLSTNTDNPSCFKKQLGVEACNNGCSVSDECYRSE